MRKTKKTLIVGIGNDIRGGDSIGIKIIEELEKINLPKNFELKKYGIRIFDLINDAKNYDKLIIVDAISESNIKKIKILHNIKIDYILNLIKLANPHIEIIFAGGKIKNINFGYKYDKNLVKEIVKLILDNYVFRNKRENSKNQK